MKAHYFMVGLIVMLCASQRTPAQTTDFDLKNYKTTDYERSSLDFKLNFNESTNDQKYNEDTPNYVYSIDNNNLRGLINLNYSVLKLTREPTS